MGTCEGCRFWEKESEYYGNCTKLKEKVDANLTTGWEGAYLNFYETDYDFGCTLFREKI